MRQRTILIASLAISLAIIGGAISVKRIVADRAARDTASSLELQAQIATREASYNELITQANGQIEALNEQVNVLKDGRDIVDGQQTIGVEAAVKAAQQSATNEDYLLGIPQLATFESQTVYDVSFTSGEVYVDAFSGVVLYSSIPVKINEQSAIEIAGAYLQVSDLSRASVQTVVVDGSDFYKVTISNYVIYVDAYGNITKVQVIQYTQQTTSTSTSSSSSSSHEREDHDEHEDEHDD